MKTYVITVSENFPSSHSRAGEETEFVQNILSYIKVHTIRSNAEFWMKRIKKIQKGEACLSVRVWSGKPYKSKQKEVLRLTSDDGVGFEIIEPSDCFLMKVFNLDAAHFAKVGYDTVAKNDGLELSDFEDWFKGWKDSLDQKIIIHFTKFRYVDNLLDEEWKELRGKDLGTLITNS